MVSYDRVKQISVVSTPVLDVTVEISGPERGRPVFLLHGWPDDVRTWERLNGLAHLEVIAGKAMHPEKGRLVELGLPFGPQAAMSVSTAVNRSYIRW